MRWYNTMNPISAMILAALVISFNLFLTDTGAFAPPTRRQDGQSSNYYVATSSTTTPTTCRQAAAAPVTLEQVVARVNCYDVTVPKPLGIVFGENPEPYLGLVVDDVAEGLNGGKAGLRMGDQLVAVNGQVVLGKDFDSSMARLTSDDAGPVMHLVLYRGPVRQLFTILGNQLDEGQIIGDDGDEEEEDDEDTAPVVMDENYESPVRIEVKEEKPLTAGDFVKAIGKLGSILVETATAPVEEPATDGENAAPKEKKKTGFFGIGGESIQLDGDDAKGYK